MARDGVPFRKENTDRQPWAYRAREFSGSRLCKDEVLRKKFMGTRSLTALVDEKGNEICVLYRQFDGYASGHGLELAGFLKSIKLVNGFSGDRDSRANGIADLAAQVVAHFKDGPGEFYLYPAGVRNLGENYLYTVTAVDGVIHLEMHQGNDSNGDSLFSGLPADFDPDKIEG